MWLFKTKLGKRILLGIIIAVMVVIVIIVYTVKSKGIFYAYTHLTGRHTSSTLQFVKTVNTLGKSINADGTIDVVQQSYTVDSELLGVDEIPDDLAEEEIDYGSDDEEVEEEEEEEYIPLDGTIIVNGWLVLHKEPSVPGSLHIDHLKSSIFTGQWSMGEGTGGTNTDMRGLYSDSSINTAMINGRPTYKNINSSGRYWVAIGPAWFNPSYIGSDGLASNNRCWAADWFADGKGKDFDISVDYNGATYYIYACCGDSKAHTFKDGLGYCQSSYDYKGVYAGDKFKDGSVIEWVNVPAGTGAALNRGLSFNGLCY